MLSELSCSAWTGISLGRVVDTPAGFEFLAIGISGLAVSAPEDELVVSGAIIPFCDRYIFSKPNEIHLAEQRAQKYWAKNWKRCGPNPAYLAIETSTIFESEIVQNLWPKLINSNTTTSYFSKSPGKHHSEVYFKGIMIFDTRTGSFVSPRGYVSVDTPPRGGVARFGDYVARYIGTGRG